VDDPTYIVDRNTRINKVLTAIEQAVWNPTAPAVQSDDNWRPFTGWLISLVRPKNGRARSIGYIETYAKVWAALVHYEIEFNPEIARTIKGIG
jgi:hypothetical protein